MKSKRQQIVWYLLILAPYMRIFEVIDNSTLIWIIGSALGFYGATRVMMKDTDKEKTNA